MKVQVEVKVPTAEGREEILAVLLRPMVKSGRLSVKRALEWIALISARTTGWTGADLAGLIRSASSFALQRFFQEREASNKIFMEVDSSKPYIFCLCLTTFFLLL